MSTLALALAILVSRTPGLCPRSLTFQHALQVETVAFSPDIEPPPLPRSRSASANEPEPFRSDQRRKGVSTGNGEMRAQRTNRCDDQVEKDGCQGEKCDRSPVKGSIFAGRLVLGPPQLEAFRLASKATINSRLGLFRQVNGEIIWGDMFQNEETSPSVMFDSRLTPSTTLASLGGFGNDGSKAVEALTETAKKQPASGFDSGDMVMVAGLLAHPESSLKVRAPRSHK